MTKPVVRRLDYGRDWAIRKLRVFYMQRKRLSWDEATNKLALMSRTERSRVWSDYFALRCGRDMQQRELFEEDTMR